MSKMETIKQFLEEKLVPITDKITNNRYVKILMDGFMGISALMIGASFFTLIRSLPLGDGYGDIMAAGILPKEDCMVFMASQDKKAKCDRFQALHNQFIASAKAVILGHKINPEFKFGCMIAANLPYAYSCNPDDQLLAQRNINLKNYFCADVLCRGEYNPMTKRFFEEEGIEIDIQDEDYQILKEGIVDFYSFSYYMSSCVSSDSQLTKVSGNMS